MWESELVRQSKEYKPGRLEGFGMKRPRVPLQRRLVYEDSGGLFRRSFNCMYESEFTEPGSELCNRKYFVRYSGEQTSRFESLRRVVIVI